jgi:hypothetical protein
LKHVGAFLNVLMLSTSIHIDMTVKKHNYVYVIYKVYVQMSQPTTCFGLFQLGHLLVGHEGQRNLPGFNADILD